MPAGSFTLPLEGQMILREVLFSRVLISMVVSGSPKRWDRWLIVHPPIGSIYHL